ncbi:uncharacterized protein LOC112486962 [Cynoglossus semilaevis]|uniref:uncharacterized protein LOC112486962 n=1 Tax=Cynoglossus semilaevis TaxID=244447 RepID=UPI000D6304B4|nr:uncharacterized protein LOC112486962 [Cynoglossus semilaevis]
MPVCHVLQGCSALSRVCPSPQDSVTLDTIVLLDQVAQTQRVREILQEPKSALLGTSAPLELAIHSLAPLALCPYPQACRMLHNALPVPLDCFVTNLDCRSSPMLSHVMQGTCVWVAAPLPPQLMDFMATLALQATGVLLALATKYHVSLALIVQPLEQPTVQHAPQGQCVPPQPLNRPSSVQLATIALMEQAVLFHALLGPSLTRQEHSLF